jgi:hypothetical protein
LYYPIYINILTCSLGSSFSTVLAPIGDLPWNARIFIFAVYISVLYSSVVLNNSDMPTSLVNVIMVVTLYSIYFTFIHFRRRKDSRDKKARKETYAAVG